jgi:hypothetical protein
VIIPVAFDRFMTSPLKITFEPEVGARPTIWGLQRVIARKAYNVGWAAEMSKEFPAPME